MANYNRGNSRGGYNGMGRGGGSTSSGNGGDGDGQHPRKNLPEVKGRFDRFCVWCGEIIVDLGLERHVRCTNNRCFRGVPINGWRRRRDGLQRCARCFSISHRSFLFCELCRRPRTESDALSHQINMDGVDPYLIDNAPGVAAAVAVAPEAAVAPVAAVAPEAAVAPVPAAVAPVPAAAAPVAAIAPAVAPARVPTPVPVWDEDDDSFMNV